VINPFWIDHNYDQSRGCRTLFLILDLQVPHFVQFTLFPHFCRLAASAIRFIFFFFVPLAAAASRSKFFIFFRLVAAASRPKWRLEKEIGTKTRHCFGPLAPATSRKKWKIRFSQSLVVTMWRAAARLKLSKTPFAAARPFLSWQPDTQRWVSKSITPLWDSKGPRMGYQFWYSTARPRYGIWQGRDGNSPPRYPAVHTGADFYQSTAIVATWSCWTRQKVTTSWVPVYVQQMAAKTLHL